MRAVIVAAAVAFLLSLFCTPLAIKGFTKLRADQPIRSEGPQTHLSKKGTPTMGGVVFVLATVIAYVAGHLSLLTLPDAQLHPTGPTITALVVLGLFVMLGLVGFLDDFLKVRKRNSLGLSKKRKLIAQTAVGAIFGVIALYVPGQGNAGTVASPYISFVKDVNWLTIGKLGALALFVFVVMAMSNAVNLTDGLDGLATGASVMVLGAYAFIGFWQYRHWAADPSYKGDYVYYVRDPLEISIIAAAAAAACFGFLWWNASPAKIFMGDTGALGLGGLIAGLAFATRTVLLVPILGMLFTIITVTWIIQIGSYQIWQRRVFRMVPLQHHFELAGWSEVNIVIRFWIIVGLGVATALGLFYADFLRVVGAEVVNT
ncbi:phospho-N-acetylmuramoyl-pentapeptide-transferase [Luedemannella flava]|uniref:Phospho-N-acetylmuramoyl-pentapeptide-transferase n=1 Tax=Luedemannella flava TaxID=349316 RepID=A0ABP4Z5I8_9ACTN